MPTNDAALVALFGVIGTFVSTMGVVLVAMINNRKERRGAAEEGVEETLRERILLRDEQIVDLREDVAERDAMIATLREERASLREENKRLRTENRELRQADDQRAH